MLMSLTGSNRQSQTHVTSALTTCAGEVENPSRTFPRALLWAVLLVVASYFLPTLAALGVTVDSADWELGYYGKVAQQVIWPGCEQAI